MENKKTKAVVINHGHLDIEWYKTVDAYRFWVAKIIDTLYDEALNKENYKSYTFDGSVFLLDDLIEYFPQYKEKISTLIKSGKLTIGPFYTQFDEWIPSGESIAKNCLWGDRKSKEYGANPMKVGYLPDNFGHPSQLPQILNQFGIDNLIFMRGMIDIDHGREFYFIGQDGTKILAVNYNYATNFLFENNKPENNNPRNIPYFDFVNPSEEKLKQFSIHNNIDLLAEEIVKSVEENKKFFSQNVVCIPMGCDHCPPQVGLGDTIEKANRMQNDVDFEFGTPLDYIKYLKQGNIDCTFKGELIGCKTECILLGVLLDRIYQKIDCFASETLLFNYALPMVAIQDRFIDKKNAFSQILDNVTKNVLINSTHDSIHGSSVDPVHKEIDARNVFNRQVTAEVVLEALNDFGSNMGKWWGDEERCVVVYNPSSERNKQLVTAWFPLGNDGIEIRDKEGKILESAIRERVFAVKNIQENPYYTDLPSADFRAVEFMVEMQPYSVQTFAWKKVERKEDVERSKEFCIENEYIKVTIDGSLINIFDKENNISYNGLNNIKDVSDAGDAWDFSEPYVDYQAIQSKDGVIDDIKISKTKLLQKITIKGHYTLPYELVGDYQSERKVDNYYTFEISLAKKIKRVDVKLTYENNAKDHLASLELPIDYLSTSVTSKGSFCINEREIIPYVPHKGWVAMPTEFYPFNEWFAINDGQKGLAIATKGLCGYKAEHKDGKTVLTIPFNRSFGIMNKTFMKRRRCAPGSGWVIDDAQCLRKTEIEYSFIPYSVVDGDRAPFKDVVNSYINNPVALPLYKSVEIGDYVTDKIIPFEIDNSNINVSIFEKSYDGKYDVLRIYESNGREETVNIKLEKYNEIYLSNLNEEKLEKLEITNGQISITLKANTICTLLCN